MSRSTKTIKQTTLIPAKPKEVYAAFLDAKKHSAFTGARAACDPKVGGRFTAWDGYISGRNLELETGRRIVQAWRTSEWPEDYPPSRLELFLKAMNGGTELRLVHSGVPAEQAESYRQGWVDYYWEPLKKYFERSRLTRRKRGAASI